MKSMLHPMRVDTVEHAHNCQHNKRHRLVQGEKRLKFRVKRNWEHFCAGCSRRMLAEAREKLDALEQQLE